MGVEYESGYDESVDARYAGTTDIITLATMYINGKWTNITELTID